MRNTSYLVLLALIVSFAATQSEANPLPVRNASFELPVIDANSFQAIPYIDGWTEIDLDAEASANTGVFANTEPNSADYIINADGNQLAFLGSQQGNALEQDINAPYKSTYAYRLTIGVGISSLLPPSQVEPADTIELAFYYRDANDPNHLIDLATRIVSAQGLSSTQLQDFSLFLPRVSPNAAWRNKAIGIAIRATGAAGGFWDLDNVRLEELLPVSIPITNASFQAPVVDPNAFQAIPYIDGWTEIDLDTQASANTGVFVNTEPNSLDHIVNADGNQLAFLGSEQGNGLEQDLDAFYRTGCEYRLTVGVGISTLYPPSQVEPVDTIELVLYYRDAIDPNVTTDIAVQSVSAAGLFSTQLQDFSADLPAVPYDANWTNKAIGIAIRATGMAGGFWDLDNVRLSELLPTSVPIENASFELPVIDPNVFPAIPVIDSWNQIDVNVQDSNKTGVFGNTDLNSLAHIVNADGDQLAFLGSGAGNAIEQDLAASYTIGCDYRLTAAVCVSMLLPPSQVEPVDTLELVLYYRDANDPNTTIDIVSEIIEAAGLSSIQLQDFSLYLPTVLPGSDWANKNIGIAIRSTGMAGGYWDLDNVRLGESLPVQESALTGKE